MLRLATLQAFVTLAPWLSLGESNVTAHQKCADAVHISIGGQAEDWMLNYSGVYEVVPGLRKTYVNRHGLYLHYSSRLDDRKLNETIPGAWVLSTVEGLTRDTMFACLPEEEGASCPYDHARSIWRCLEDVHLNLTFNVSRWLPQAMDDTPSSTPEALSSSSGVESLPSAVTTTADFVESTAAAVNDSTVAAATSTNQTEEPLDDTTTTPSIPNTTTRSVGDVNSTAARSSTAQSMSTSLPQNSTSSMAATNTTRLPVRTSSLRGFASTHSSDPTTSSFVRTFSSTSTSATLHLSSTSSSARPISTSTSMPSSTKTSTSTPSSTSSSLQSSSTSSSVSSTQSSTSSPDFFKGAGYAGEFDGIDMNDMLDAVKQEDDAEAAQEKLQEAVYWGLSPGELAVYGGFVAAFVLGLVFVCQYLSTQPRAPRRYRASSEIEPWEPQEETRALAIGTLSVESGARAYQSLGGGP